MRMLLERRRIETFRKGVAEQTYAKFAAGQVVIWSGQRRAYLRPDGKTYTSSRDRAGRYTLKQALAAAFHRCRSERLWLERIELPAKAPFPGLGNSLQGGLGYSAFLIFIAVFFAGAGGRGT
jgi:hypothetical protein